MAQEVPRQLDNSFASNILNGASGPVTASFNAMMIATLVLPAFVTISMAKLLGGMNFLQVVAFQAMMNVSQPANSMIYLDFLRKILNADSLEWTLEIFYDFEID